MFLTLLCTLAWALEPAAGLGVRGVRASDGLHRLQPTVGVWVRHNLEAKDWYVEAEVLGGGRSDQLLDGAIRQAILSPALLVGREVVHESTRLFGAAGLGGFFMIGGVDFDQWMVRPTVRGQWGLDRTLKSGWVLGAALGGAFRGNGGEMDLLFRMGRGS